MWMLADRCTVLLLRLTSEVHGVGARPWGGLSSPHSPPGAGSDTNSIPVPAVPQPKHSEQRWDSKWRCQDWRGSMQGSDRQGAASRAFPSQMQLSSQDAAVCRLLPVINPKTSCFQSRRALMEGVHVDPCNVSGSINTSPGNFCVFSLPYAADSHHHRVDGHPQLWRICAPIHRSGLCWAGHNHRPEKSQGRTTPMGWENKLFEGRYVLWQAFLLLFSFFFKVSNKKRIIKDASFKIGEKRRYPHIKNKAYIKNSNKGAQIL